MVTCCNKYVTYYIMLSFHVLLPVFCAIFMNGIIYTFRLNNNNNNKRFLPPGYMIGIIWTILFSLLGYVHYRLYSLNNKMNFGSISIVLFILFALAYPLMSGYFMNVISLILSFILSLIVMMYSKHIVVFLIPLLLWVSYVNLVVFY